MEKLEQPVKPDQSEAKQTALDEAQQKHLADETKAYRKEWTDFINLHMKAGPAELHGKTLEEATALAQKHFKAKDLEEHVEKNVRPGRQASPAPVTDEQKLRVLNAQPSANMPTQGGGISQQAATQQPAAQPQAPPPALAHAERIGAALDIPKIQKDPAAQAAFHRLSLLLAERDSKYRGSFTNAPAEVNRQVNHDVELLMKYQRK